VNVSVENLGPCKKLLRVEVPVEKVNATFDAVTAEFQKAAQLPGFRPGKAPKHLITRSYEPRIVEETRKKLVEESFRAAAQQEKLNIVVTLDVEDQQFGRNQALQFTATVEVAPDFALPNYKGLAAKRELTVATEADVERALGILREQHAQYNDVDRPVQDGDVAVVNYTGTTDGKPLTDIAPTALGLTKKENFWVLIKANSFLPGFTEPLVGAVKGDKRTVTVTLAEDFVHKELSGKTVAYEVEILGVKEKLLPVVDDAFAKQFGADVVATLLQGIRTDLQRELDFRQKRSVRDQIIKALSAQVDFELPESLVSNETRNLVYNVVNENQQRGVAKEFIEQKRDEIFTNAQVNARERVKTAFILNRIAAEEKLRVEDRDITQRVLQLAQQNNLTPEKMVKAIQERNAVNEIRQDILTGKVLDFLEVNAAVEDVAALPAATPAAPATTA
jgi:trigger factor